MRNLLNEKIMSILEESNKYVSNAMTTMGFNFNYDNLDRNYEYYD